MNAAMEYGFSGVKVSIIVPIHNSDKYLRDCLISALTQTFTDLEVLCIDTGIAARCSEIIAELGRTDSRIIHIKDANGSYGHKINAGIKAAAGGYVAILESDDQMAPDMVERLYAVAQEYNTDVVDGDFDQLFDYKGKNLRTSGRKYSDAQVYDHLIRNEKGSSKIIAENGIWTALYRKDFLLEENIWLNESPGASYQDMSFLFLTSLLARSSYHLSASVYWYRMDNTGSSVKDNSKIYEIIGECEFLKKELEKRGIYGQRESVLYLSRKYSAYYWNYRRLSEDSRRLFLERYISELRQDLEAGAIRRDMFDDIAYRQTFLLLDDIVQFKEFVAESDRNKPVEALSEMLDEFENRGIMLFGAGIFGRKVLDILCQNENKILGICDNAEQLHGTSINGIAVWSVKKAVEKYPDACYLIVNRKHSDAMREQLLAEGISATNIKIFS